MYNLQQENVLLSSSKITKHLKQQEQEPYIFCFRAGTTLVSRSLEQDSLCIGDFISFGTAWSWSNEWHSVRCASHRSKRHLYEQVQLRCQLVRLISWFRSHSCFTVYSVSRSVAVPSSDYSSKDLLDTAGRRVFRSALVSARHISARFRYRQHRQNSSPTVPLGDLSAMWTLLRPMRKY